MRTEYTMPTTPTRQINARVELRVGSTPYVTEFTSNDRLKSVKIDRVGEEGKLFGFGICQKITFEIIENADNRGDYTNTDWYCKAYFNEVDNFPTFHIKEVKRNEKTNVVTFVGYDLLEEAKHYTYTDLDLAQSGLEEGYGLFELAGAISAKLGAAAASVGVSDDNTFGDNILYNENNPANLNGTETLREILDDIAEATLTVYSVDSNDNIAFRELYYSRYNKPYLTIDTSQYFELTSSEPIYFGGIASVTELGDNLIADAENGGAIQYVRNNAFLDNYEGRAEWLAEACNILADTEIAPFTCAWRGNYLAEPADFVEIHSISGEYINAYIINDTITYNGGFKQVTSWQYKKTDDKPENSPNNLGEAIKQTYAKVDKVNKQIDIVASETSENAAAISALIISTDGISSTVEALNKTSEDAAEELVQLKNTVNASMTAEGVQLIVQSELNNGVDKVVTSTGYTLNEEGLTVSKSGSEMETQISEDGMTVAKSGKDVLTANHTGVNATNLHATTYLIVGNNSRFEDYGNRTGCFWIGG